jgi:glutathione S-transferase
VELSGHRAGHPEGRNLPPEFRAINPNGKILILVFEDGRILSEFNAILFHFAEATGYWPVDPFARAQMMQWLFWEQYIHAEHRYLPLSCDSTES